ncbi:MAG: fibronectin type III protein [uncultured bacterium]|nr:MAG: fibronectin type III protein [uncultured bacterium]
MHVLGGTVMEYCDEWHKNIAHNYNTQDYGGFPLRYDQPDNYVNEEWWGLFSIESDGTNLNILKPRKVVTGLKFEFNNINQNNDLISPEDVTNLNAIPGDRQVGLTWINSINSKNDLKDQLLYINNDSGFGEPISLGKVTNSRLITSLQNNLNYSFKITTIDISGNESAGKSISCTPVDNNPPEDVENFTVIAQDESVALSWAPSPNSNGDLVNQLLYIDNGAGYGLAISLGASTLNYTVNSLTNNTLYHFKITCIDNANNESEGALVLATPQSSLAPLVIITSPASSLVSNSNVITIQGTVSNNQAIIKVNGTFVANTGGSFMAENILLPNEGENTISVTAEYGGNVGQNQIFVIRDTTSPTIKITSPKNGETITGHI